MAPAWLMAVVLLSQPAAAQPVADAEAPPAAALTTLPLGKGLPVVVRAGLYFADITAIDENDGSFTATVDVRLRWQDPRLRYQAASPGTFVDLRADAAEARLAEIWSPDVTLSNMLDEPTYQLRGVRLYPDGVVELMQRTTARFRIDFDVLQFPFDRQRLDVELASRRDTAAMVMLDYRQDDLDFSRLAGGVELAGWDAGLVNILRDPLPGWYGERHARLRVGLEVTRQASKTMAGIFIPLFASLLIPLLAMWLNKVEDGAFKIEAFELTNIVIGGLFAVIALNFTVNSEYRTLGSGDNTVSRLFGLNYVTLAVSFGINIVLFRFNLVARKFGKHVQEQVYVFLTWAVPLLALSTATAFVLVALA